MTQLTVDMTSLLYLWLRASSSASARDLDYVEERNSSRRCGVAPGDQPWHQEVLIYAAVGQRPRILPGYDSACGNDHGMACRDIPFAGGPETRVNVGGAFGDTTKF